MMELSRWRASVQAQSPKLQEHLHLHLPPKPTLGRVGQEYEYLGTLPFEVPALWLNMWLWPRVFRGVDETN